MLGRAGGRRDGAGEAVRDELARRRGAVVDEQIRLRIGVIDLSGDEIRRRAAVKNERAVRTDLLLQRIGTAVGRRGERPGRTRYQRVAVANTVVKNAVGGIGRWRIVLRE